MQTQLSIVLQTSVPASNKRQTDLPPEKVDFVMVECSMERSIICCHHKRNERGLSLEMNWETYHFGVNRHQELCGMSVARVRDYA